MNRLARLKPVFSRVCFLKMEDTRHYQTILDEMYGLRRFGIKLGLSTIRNILKRLGNPQDGFRSVHVAGSNGKGSIASTLKGILSRSGYKVGLYTSPHLVRFNERILIDNRPISDKAVVSSYQRVRRAHKGSRQPTFFEFTTAMAFSEFKRNAVDWAIIETGMGGRLDATNVLSPALSIISNISLEHQMYLGNTIEQIAREKGGIIKPHTPAVTGARQNHAIAALGEIAAKHAAPLFRLGRDFKVRKNRNSGFTYFGMDHVLRNLETKLQGAYQKENAALALAACEILMRQNVRIPIEAISTALKEAVWPGRLEIVSRSPLVLLDGAHNRAAAKKLAEYLKDRFDRGRVVLVAGILNDKPYAAMLKHLLPCCRQVIVTRPRINRGLAPETLADVARQTLTDVTVTGDVESAVNLALQNASSQDVICIAGSLYVVGEARGVLEKKHLLT